MYESEHDFSCSVMRNFKKNFVVAYRIETGSTAQGVPDIYAMYKYDDYFVETKNSKAISLFSSKDMTDTTIQRGVPDVAVKRVEKLLRSDQVVFGHHYIHNHITHKACGNIAKRSFVLAACKDGVMLGYISFNARLQLITAFNWKEWRGKNIVQLLAKYAYMAVPFPYS